MASLANLKTGPCEIYFDATLIGNTEGDISFTPNFQTRERKVHQYGENRVDIIALGDNVEVSFAIAEATLANIQLWWPEATVETNNVYFGKKPGWKGSTYAVRLMLRPIDCGDNSEDFVLFKAVITERAEISFGHEDDRQYGITMAAIVDDAKADGKLLGYMRVPTGT